MELWRHHDNFLNTNRIVRIEKLEKDYLVYWLDENNEVLKLSVDPAGWVSLTRALQCNLN
jgi:hypothetical protein